jgi:hypothetical protein
MLAYILALAVALGSFALYMAAFFFPEVHRKSDFIWSGVALFYALVLWVCAGRITGGVLLGQTASVALLGWFGWQTLRMRWDLTPPDQKTQLPAQATPAALRGTAEQVREKLISLSSSENVAQIKDQASRLFNSVKERTQGNSGSTQPPRSTTPSASGTAVPTEVVVEPESGGPSSRPTSSAQAGTSNPLASLSGIVDTVKGAIANLGQKKPSRPMIELNHPPKSGAGADTDVSDEFEDEMVDVTPPTAAPAPASPAISLSDDEETVLLPTSPAVPATPTAANTDAELVSVDQEESILNNTTEVAPEAVADVAVPDTFTPSGDVAAAIPEETATPEAVERASTEGEVRENPLGDPFVPAEAIPVDAAEIDLAPPAEPIGPGDPIERQQEEVNLDAPPIEPATYTLVEPEAVEDAIAASEATSEDTPELKRPNPPNPFLVEKAQPHDPENSESSENTTD